MLLPCPWFGSRVQQVHYSSHLQAFQTEGKSHHLLILPVVMLEDGVEEQHPQKLGTQLQES
jgi:hypothetical protein